MATSLGAPVEDLFMSFDREPLASGSIGQVHLARLSPQGASHTGLPAGTQVAVKVLPPRCHQSQDEARQPHANVKKSSLAYEQS